MRLLAIMAKMPAEFRSHCGLTWRRPHPAIPHAETGTIAEGIRSAFVVLSARADPAEGPAGAVRNLAHSADTTDERQRQMAGAKSWAEETRPKMLADEHFLTDQDCCPAISTASGYDISSSNAFSVTRQENAADLSMHEGSAACAAPGSVRRIAGRPWSIARAHVRRQRPDQKLRVT
jgi:hypothetical protein